MIRPPILTRRAVLRLFQGVTAVVAGMTVFPGSGGGALHSKAQLASREGAERALLALRSSDIFAQFAQELSARGFDLAAAEAQPATVDRLGTAVTLRAAGSSDQRAAFIAGVVDGGVVGTHSVFATVFERRSAEEGVLTVLHAQQSSVIAAETRTVSIARRCPPGQVCPTADDGGGGGCIGCCSGWYQVSYIRCVGLTQYNCVALERSCCCCNNAAQCWYEHTGENCSFYCTAGCAPGNCQYNACGGCA